MKTFKVIGNYITFHIGMIIGLSLKQYETRKHALNVIEKATVKEPGIFKVTDQTGLKRGETFKADLTLTKADYAILEDITPPSQDAADSKSPDKSDKKKTDSK
jgi:hypothetical protein